VKLRRRGLALALVRDLREHRAPVSEEDLADFETGVLAGFVLARAPAGWPTARSAMTRAACMLLFRLLGISARFS